jgi:hypothetical protein
MRLNSEDSAEGPHTPLSAFLWLRPPLLAQASPLGLTRQARSPQAAGLMAVS